MDQSDSIRRQFGANAERYAASDYHRGGDDLEAMVGAAELSGGERVLDVGCGTGFTAFAFAPHVAEVVALDLTPAMLEQARALAGSRGLSNLRFETGDAMALPFADRSFDVVTCRVCAHHFSDPAAAAREAARVLRRGGRFLLVDSVAPESPAEDTFLNAIELIRDPSHVRDHRVSEWLSLLRAAGFEAEWLGTRAVSLDFEDWVERMGTPHPARVALRALFGVASAGVREALRLRTSPRAGFDIPIALFRGRPATR
jgi:SAM-dependent methyltransferase